MAHEFADPPMPNPSMTIHAGRMFAFIPGSDHLVVSGIGPIPARVISLTTGQEIFKLEKPLPFVLGIAVSHDGAVIAVAAHAAREAVRDRVILYDAQTGGKMLTLRAGYKADLSGLEFAPGSHAFLYASSSGLTALDPTLNPAVRPLRGSAEYPDNTVYYGIAFSSLGERFASVWWHDRLGANISLFDWPSGEEKERLPCRGPNRLGPSGEENDMVAYGERYPRYHESQLLFSLDDQSLLLSMPDGSVARWSLTALSQSSTPWIKRSVIPSDPDSAGRMHAARLCFSPDGTLLAYGQGNTLSLWSWPFGECLGKWLLPGRESMPYQVGFSPSGFEIVISRYGSGGIFVYHIADLIT